MPYAADASTLIYLAKANALNEAFEVLGVMRVPQAVWKEAVDDGEARGAPEVARIRQALEANRLSRVDLSDDERERAQALASTERLGRGESETLALAGTTGVAVIDDARAVRAAYAHGIRSMSTLLIPLSGRNTGRLDTERARELLHRLALVVNPRAEVLLAVENRLKEEQQ